MILLKLFLSFFQVGLFTFGGGYASLPLIQEQVLEKNHWLTQAEFMDVLTISQMTPGPIAINASTFVGTKVAGLPGAIVATVGCVTPSCIIVLILAGLYYRYKGFSLIEGIIKGLRPAVVALIGSAAFSILLTTLFSSDSFPIEFSNINWAALILMLASLLLLKKFRLNPIHVMLLSGAAGVILYGFVL